MSPFVTAGLMLPYSEQEARLFAQTRARQMQNLETTINRTKDDSLSILSS